MSSIRLRQFHIKETPIGETPFAHNYLTLYDDNGNLVSEMHGLAFDPKEKRYVPVGSPSDYLRFQEYPGGKSGLYLPGQNEKVLLDRPGDDLSKEWETMRATGEKINRKNLMYNKAGSDMNGPRDWDAPVPDVISGNSNSVNRTLLDSLRIPVPSMPLWTPGKENPLLREKELFPPQIKGGLLSPAQPNADPALPNRGLLSPVRVRGGLLGTPQPSDDVPDPIY